MDALLDHPYFAVMEAVCMTNTVARVLHFISDLCNLAVQMKLTFDFIPSNFVGLNILYRYMFCFMDQ